MPLLIALITKDLRDLRPVPVIVSVVRVTPASLFVMKKVKPSEVSTPYWSLPMNFRSPLSKLRPFSFSNCSLVSDTAPLTVSLPFLISMLDTAGALS